ncbi:MAG: FHA domain-containing protein, partial [Lachnospiraceae bacterium]|nr:FHA domain-containing protein [Lachnospiraceae bacterium]
SETQRASEVQQTAETQMEEAEHPTERREQAETEQSTAAREMAETTEVKEGGEMPEAALEKNGFDQVTDFLQDNLIICIASGLVIIALLIILISLLQRRKGVRTAPELKKTYYGENLSAGDANKFSEEFTYDDEKTIDELGAFDDEATIDAAGENGLRLRFEITFHGQTETVERLLREQLILGRGEECDVDVVLHSALEERKQTSRKHAIIFEQPDGLYVKDNSKNKTYLNGVEVMGKMMLRDGDVLQLGKATVKVKILGY